MINKFETIRLQAERVRDLSDEQIDELVSEEALLARLARSTDFVPTQQRRPQRHVARAILAVAATLVLVPAIATAVHHPAATRSEASSVVCFTQTRLDSPSEVTRLAATPTYGCSATHLYDAASDPRWVACILPTGAVGAFPTRQRDVSCATLALAPFSASDSKVSTTGLEAQFTTLNADKRCISSYLRVQQVTAILGSHGVASWRIKVDTDAPCTAVAVNSEARLLRIVSKP